MLPAGHGGGECRNELLNRRTTSNKVKYDDTLREQSGGRKTSEGQIRNYREYMEPPRDMG